MEVDVTTLNKEMFRDGLMTLMDHEVERRGVPIRVLVVVEGLCTLCR